MEARDRSRSTPFGSTSDITKGTVLSDSFPYPAQVNVKNFPGLKQYFADMKASGKSDLSQAKLKTSDFSSWISTLAFVNATKGVDSFSPATVIEALQTVKDVDLLGLAPPWTPSTPGLQRVQVELEPLRVHLPVQRQGHRHQQDTGRRHAVHPVTAG